MKNFDNQITNEFIHIYLLNPRSNKSFEIKIFNRNELILIIWYFGTKFNTLSEPTNGQFHTIFLT